MVIDFVAIVAVVRAAASSLVCTPFASFHRSLSVDLRSIGRSTACAAQGASP
jgi:hypothetical protein